MRIAVIGGHQANPEQLQEAEALGGAIAVAGATLICGGLGGIMEAACRGARLAGGVTIGILPGLLAEEANDYVLYPIVTGIGDARNSIVVRSAEVVIAVAGSTGTLSEIAYALKSNIPVFSLRSWNIPGVVQVASPAEAVVKAVACLKEEPSDGEVPSAPAG